MIRAAIESLRRLHRDEVGSQGLEQLLILAAVTLPLLGLLIIFRNELRDWVVQVWKDVRAQDGGSNLLNPQIPPG
jgi:Flp pilus assembly pilin Flp